MLVCVLQCYQLHHVFLLGLQHMVDLTGSLILAMALFMARLSVSQATWLTRLETEFQVISLLHHTMSECFCRLIDGAVWNGIMMLIEHTSTQPYQHLYC